MSGTLIALWIVAFMLNIHLHEGHPGRFWLGNMALIVAAFLIAGM